MNNTKLTKAAKKSRAEYFKQYRKLHPERVAAWSATYWNRRAQREAAAAAEKGQGEVEA